MKSIDLFSGAGGLTLGLHDAGWEPVAALDLDPHANRTFRANFPGVHLLEQDAADARFSRFRGAVDLVAGGPPCQPFSVAGLQRAHEDPRDGVPHFIRAVREALPASFLMENVRGLDTPRYRAYLRRALAELAELGYSVSAQVLDAADFGVPQRRQRLFVVGVRGPAFVFPAPTHGPRGRQDYVPSGPAIAAAPPDHPNTALVVYARNPVLRAKPTAGMLVNGGGRPFLLDQPSPTIPASAGGNRTHIVDEHGVLAEYHAQLVAGFPPRTGVVDGVRRLTVAESAALQAFPSGYQLTGTMHARYRQVGNAVPPLLARAVGAALLRHLQHGPADADAEPAPRQAPLLADVVP